MTVCETVMATYSRNRINQMEQAFKYQPKSAWETYDDADSRRAMANMAREYAEFLSQCKTERETIAWAQRKLAAAAFSEEPESGKFMRSLRQKALFAAKKGETGPQNGFLLIAAHGDSPRLDFKQHPLIEQAGVAQAKTHYYGGIRKYQWLARPLALHGIIMLANGDSLEISIGEKADEPVFCVADLLPHLAKKQQGKTLADVFEGEKLNIILGHEPESGSGDEKDAVKARLLALLHERYGIVEEDFITADLEAVPAGPAHFVGFDKSLLGAYGQDDRICVFCALKAFLDAGPSTASQALIIWDKEEIGSDGATGASSRFLEYCLADLCRWWGEVNFGQAMLATRAISADVTAALDPDFQDLHDKGNAALLGYGPCFSKYTGSGGKYGASEADAEYFALLRQLFNKNGIPWQAAMLGKVDSGGGGTVALYLAAYGMNVIDLGPALLSMHSPFELSSVADVFASCKAYQCFYEM